MNDQRGLMNLEQLNFLNEQEIKVVREVGIAVPPPESEELMAIRRLDWQRIMSKISRSENPVPKLSVIYSIFFGTAASSGVSIIPIAKSQSLPAWVTPLYVCIFLFSLSCGCIFAWLAKKLSSERKSEIQEVLEEMKNVENLYRS